MADYAFYIYEDDPEDPRFSFWMHVEDGNGLSLYERPPEGHGMWLKVEEGSDHERVEPSDSLKGVIADLLDDGVEGGEILDLPPHERYFVQVIHGTVEDNPDSIPAPVWHWMNSVADEVGV